MKYFKTFIRLVCDQVLVLNGRVTFEIQPKEALRRNSRENFAERAEFQTKLFIRITYLAFLLGQKRGI